jgi:hypothetical protein
MGSEKANLFYRDRMSDIDLSSLPQPEFLVYR